LARPEIEPKTALGRRFRDLRSALGIEERADLAARLGIGVSTIAKYERGETEPTAGMLEIYRTRTGVDANWLLSGEGEMFADPAKAPASARTVDPDILEKLGDIVDHEHRKAGVALRPAVHSAEVARAYNDLVALVTDLGDAGEVDDALPLVRRKMQRRITEAKAAPGAGKRAAS